MQVLHFKDYDDPNLGPHIRKCCKCAIRLWIASDGVWTDDHEVWKDPPEGYINCEEARKKAR